MVKQNELLKSAAQTNQATDLVCRLRRKTAAGGRASPTAGEVELENTSSQAIEIQVQMSPWQYLNLVVCDSSDNIVSEGHYGDCFSPVSEPYLLRLLPGEKLLGDVALLGNVPPDKRRSRQYSVRAIYEYQGRRAVSEPLQLQSLLPGSATGKLEIAAGDEEHLEHSREYMER